MACSASEFITDVTVTVDEALYKDTSLLKVILQDYMFKKKGSCYHIQGSYQEIENLCITLSTLKQHAPSTKYEDSALKQHARSTKYEDSALKQHAPSTKYEDSALKQHTPSTKYEDSALKQHAPSTKYEDSALKQASNKDGSHQGKHPPAPALQLEVAGVVMDYIEHKRSKELDRIQGSDFRIDIHSSRARSDPAGTTAVTFKPRHRDVSQARAHFVRERFITFYQRIATDLQVRTLNVPPYRDYGDVQRTFSELLIEPERSKGRAKVTGPFLQILRLEDFLRNGGSTSTDRRSPRLSPPPHGAAVATASGPSPAHASRPEEEEDESCAICMDAIGVKETLRCKHSFCKDCLKRAFEYKPVCPTCGVLYGALRGTQPEGGTMNVTRESSSLPGYEKHKTIVIHYCIPSGVQKEEHPSPGHRYEGASRTAYLPDSPEGRRVLDLLRRAFDQRLTFTIGRSTTSGRNNVVTWNDIHHKTSVHGGPTCYGYPDPDYLRRLKDELKVKGIE